MPTGDPLARREPSTPPARLLAPPPATGGTHDATPAGNATPAGHAGSPGNAGGATRPGSSPAPSGRSPWARLVVVLSESTVEHLGRLARSGWTGTVVAVGSVEEAQEVLAQDQRSTQGSTQGSAQGSAQGEGPRSVAATHPGPHGRTAGATPAEEAGTPAVLRLDRDRRRAVHGPRSCPLTPLEFGVLDVLLIRPGQVRTAEDLTRTVWGTAHTGDSAHLHAVVRRLRRKLRGIESPLELVAVRGIGFRLAPPAGASAELRHAADPPLLR